MATLLDQAGSAVSGMGWSALGNIVFYVALCTMIILVIAFVLLIMWWRSFGIKVKIYTPIGQVNISEEERDKIIQYSSEDMKQYLKKKHIKYSTISYKKTKGKDVNIKGVNYFQIFSPFRKISNVPMSLRYSDGVHIVRLAKDLFIPIIRPETIINIDGSIEIFVKEDNNWKLWNRMESNLINARYQDIDAQKKVVFYFVIGIVAMVLIGGFLLWLIYKSAVKGFDNNMAVAQRFTDFAKGLGETTPT